MRTLMSHVLDLGQEPAPVLRRIVQLRQSTELRVDVADCADHLQIGNVYQTSRRRT